MAVAWVLSLAVAGLVGLHVYWAFGGEWGLRAALGGHAAPPRAVIWAVAVALALAVGGALVLGRAGVWQAGVPGWVFRFGTWALAVAFALGALVNLAGRTKLERLGFAPACLVLAGLCTVVAW